MGIDGAFLQWTMPLLYWIYSRMEQFPRWATTELCSDRHSFKKLCLLPFQQDWSIRKFTMRLPALQFHSPRYPPISCFRTGNLWTSYFSFFPKNLIFAAASNNWACKSEERKHKLNPWEREKKKRAAASVLVVQQKDIAEKSTTAILGFKAPRVGLKKATKTMKLSRRKEVVKSHLLARSRGKDSVLILGYRFKPQVI